MLSRITVAQVGRQNEATVGFGDNTCGSILLPKSIGSRTRPRDVSIERRHFQASAARRGDTEPTLLSPRLSRFALFLSTDSAHPVLRKRLLLAPSVVITSPYLCILHNEAFVSRIGMIDHLAGMHGMPLHRSVPTLRAIVFFRPIKFLLTATFTRFALLG